MKKFTDGCKELCVKINDFFFVDHQYTAATFIGLGIGFTIGTVVEIFGVLKSLRKSS